MKKKEDQLKVGTKTWETVIHKLITNSDFYSYHFINQPMKCY